MRVNHYKWLEKHFVDFAKKVGLKGYETVGDVQSLNSAHGDKAYCYKWEWERAGIKFPQGVAIFFLTYHSPWESECRETDNGWIDVCKWVVDNKERFLPLLPPVDENDPDILSI